MQQQTNPKAEQTNSHKADKQSTPDKSKRDYTDGQPERQTEPTDEETNTKHNYTKYEPLQK